MGATALFIASKAEEMGRRLQHLIMASYKVAQKNNNAEITQDSKEYWTWRDIILYNEELMLEALCYDLTITHPYQSILEFQKKYTPDPDQKEITKIAWALVNDR